MPGVGGAEFALAWREGGVRRRCAGRLELERLSLSDGRVALGWIAVVVWLWYGVVWECVGIVVVKLT